MLDSYVAQIRLLVKCLPVVAHESAFALKGGTAINLFYRDLPRLSVDIDLTFLPTPPRDESLAAIREALDRIAADLRSTLPAVQVRPIAGGGGGDTRLLVRQGKASVKIETSTVTRGTVHQPDLRRVSGTVEQQFGFAETTVVSFSDLFAGKLVAALDRQHPRDLFDVMLLYANEGISDELFRTFLVYVACSHRPMHEILDPHLLDLSTPFEQQFAGMATIPVAVSDLYEARSQLIADIRTRLDESSKRFLLGVHDCEPEFSLIGLPEAANLPAVQWKLLNLERLLHEDTPRHREQRAALESALR